MGVSGGSVIWQPGTTEGGLIGVFALYGNPLALATRLGVFGPFGLLAILGLLSAGVIICYTGLYWAPSAHLSAPHAASFGDYLYFSAGAFVSATTSSTPSDSLGRAIQIVEAANGLGFLAIAIGYLPALSQAFSQREVDVSRLDARAGSPPSAAMLHERSSERGGWSELDAYLREWPYAIAISRHLALELPDWVHTGEVRENWRTLPQSARRHRLLP